MTRQDDLSAAPPEAVTRWLADFERALTAADGATLGALFLPDAHWRDLLAFTWRVCTTSGAASIAKLTAHSDRIFFIADFIVVILQIG